MTSSQIERNEHTIRNEIEHISICAMARDAPIVRLGELVFFSTDTGDAWMLDSADSLSNPCTATASEMRPNNNILGECSRP